MKFHLISTLTGASIYSMNRRSQNEIKHDCGPIANLVRLKRKELGYNQSELSQRIGVGLRFLKELEIGKKTLRMDKVEQVLNYFGYTLYAIPLKEEVEK